MRIQRKTHLSTTISNSRRRYYDTTHPFLPSQINNLTQNNSSLNTSILGNLAAWLTQTLHQNSSTSPLIFIIELTQNLIGEFILNVCQAGPTSGYNSKLTCRLDGVKSIFISKLLIL